MYGRIVQTGALCFERVETMEGACLENTDDLVEGYVRELTLGDKFSIEDMDYSFRGHACVKYHTQEPFLELLGLDAIEAVNREYENGDFPILSGIYVNLNQGKAGELRFLPGATVRGVRIIVKEAFYNACLKSRFPRDELDISRLLGMYGGLCRNPRLRMIFGQIRDSIRSGVDSEIYYESKVTEMLYIVTHMDTQTVPAKRPLAAADLSAVEKARGILDERLSAPPKIAELAKFTGTSSAKLQRDFKAAFGTTIHAYIQSLRMSRALARMEWSEEPLYVIARDVGCKNPGRFAELFKKTYGVTPDEYRRNLHG
jgi:AraC-like DNA-binding protein